MFRQSRYGIVDVISGETPLNAEHKGAFLERLETTAARGQPRVVLDLQSVPLVDSAGLEAILEARQRCQRRGGVLAIAAPNHLVRDILRITGIDEQVEIHEDVTSAVRTFAL